jgi:putative ABC transport system permease protein
VSLRWWRLAGRNLLRHRRRTFLTGSIVVVGFVAVTMTAGFMAQTFEALRKTTVETLGGEISLLDPRAAGKTEEEAQAYLLDDWEGLARLVRKDPRVVRIIPKLSFFGLAVRGDRSAAYMGTGTDPKLEREAGFLPQLVIAGSFFDSPDGDEVMLGAGVARALGARAGDLVTVMTTMADGSLNAVDATVAAILRYPIREIDDRVLFLPYRAAARLLGAEGKASTLAIRLAETRETEAVAREIAAEARAAGRPVAVRTWLESAAFYKQVRLLYIAIFLFTGLVLAVVIVLAVANTMTMSVFERTREIGTLLAIGMERRRVRRLFLYEGILLALVGTLVGSVLSLLLRSGLNASGLEMPTPPGGTGKILLHIRFFPAAYGAGFLMMTATLLVASWWPARRAANLNPVEALAHV